MSGIVCLVGNDPFVTKKALALLKHRGRSRKVLSSRGNYQLGSIVGPGLYKTQCFYSDNKGQSVFDGFLYKNSDVPFAKRILQMYREYGRKFISRLDGIFAFVLNDENNILLARDSFGLKPLYYGATKNYLLFASELKAISPFCREVNVFPPGYYFTMETGFVKYFDFEVEISEKYNVKFGVAKMASLLKNTLEEAVRKRLKILETQPSVLLSGGLDSSCIAAATLKNLGYLKTFTVGFKDSEDIMSARQVAEFLGTEHYDYSYDLDEMLKLLPEVIYYLESFDSSLVRSAIPNYIASRLACEKESYIVFTGEGADEIFAGYNYIKKKSADEIDKELKRMLKSGHKTGFQRNDRINLACGLEYDVPFMDRKMIELAFSLPVKWKIHGKDHIEKWILRKAFEKTLPENIVWRKKRKFSIGAGSSNILGEYAEEKISDAEFERDTRNLGNTIIKSKEELLYYQIFRELFPNKSIIKTVGRTQNHQS